MIITIILLILAYSILGKPIDKLVEKIKNVNWNELTSKAWNGIKAFSLKAGRAACTPLLLFYYVMSDEKTSVGDKALIYGGILYLISPVDLLPRRVLGWLGVIDNVAVIAFIVKKISDKITPEIEAKVNTTLDEWFGSSSVAPC